MPLNAKKIEAHLEKGKYADGNGLYLNVTANGAKSWIYRYTLNKRTREMGLGPLDHVKLSEAREMHRDLMHKVKVQKIDPIDERDKKRLASESDFKSVAEQFIEMKSQSWKNPKHHNQWINTLTDYAYPYIGDKPVQAISAAMVRELLDPIWTTKHETATRVRSRIQNVIDYAIAMGLSDKANPATNDVISKVLPTVKKSEVKSNFAAMPYADLPAFYADLCEKDTIGAYCLRWTILTGCRSGESMGMMRSEVQGDVWTVPAKRMKAGREHRYPLCDYMLEFLDSLPVLSNYYFPAMKKSGLPHISNNTMLKLLKADMGQPFTVHGFRSTFSDWVREQTDYDRMLAEMQLAHMLDNKTEAAYARTDYLEKRRPMAEDWCLYASGGKA